MTNHDDILACSASPSPTLSASIESIVISTTGRVLLKDCVLPCPEGSIIGITGQTGCGKSTLLRVLAGINDWRSRSIVAIQKWQLSGTSCSSPTALAFLDQSPRRNLVTRRVHDELAFSLAANAGPLSEQHSRANAVATALGLHTLLHNATTDLSIGEAQRVALGEALCRKCRLVLLDEPSVHLDEEARTALSQLLNEYVQTNSETTIVIASHDLAFLRDVCEVIFAFDESQLRLLNDSFGDGHETPVAPGGNAISSQVLCKLRDLSIWRNGRLLFSDLSFDIYAGECIILRGPNGSGKTTLLEVLAGVGRRDVRVAGDIRFDDTSTKRHGLDMPEDCSLVFQDPDAQILGLTIDEEAMLYTAFATKAVRSVEDVISRWGLSRDMDTLYLSYGQKRLISMLPLHLHNPRLILLDEPMSGLDVSMRNKVIAILAALQKEGAAIVIATHDPTLKDVFGGREILLPEGE